LPLIKNKSDRGFLENAQKQMQDWREVMEQRATRTEKPMKPQVIAYNLNRLLRDDAIVSVDSGTIATWAARYIDMRGEMQFSISGMLASMACSLPYSIGAAVAHPDRQIICIVGDGGMSMLMGEIATAAKYNLPIKAIVFRNNSLGMIRWEQMVLDGNPEFGVDLQPIDFAKVAEACGATGFSIVDPRNAEQTLREALAHDGPVVVDCLVDPNEPPLPGNITMKQAMNFAKAIVKGEKDGVKIIKSVLKEQVREVI
jgi:pyruvate dehydrogenase (quinone)